MATGEQDTPDPLRAAVEGLYAVAPGEFIARRTALVKQARSNGLKELANEIGALRKPSVSAWAVNQVVRARAHTVAQLRDLGARLRHAQSTLDAAALGGLRAERDEALAGLVRGAGEVSARSGHPLTAAADAEVRDTGIAALADAGAEEVAWSGALTRSLSYSGFGEVDVSDAVARTGTGVILTRIEGGGESDGPAESPEDRTAVGSDGSAEALSGPDQVGTAGAEEDKRHTDADARLAEVKALLDRADHELAARTAQVDQARRRSESTRSRVAKLRADLERAESEDEDARGALTAAEESRDHAEADRDQAASAIPGLRSQPNA